MAMKDMTLKSVEMISGFSALSRWGSFLTPTYLLTPVKRALMSDTLRSRFRTALRTAVRDPGFDPLSLGYAIIEAEGSWYSIIRKGLPWGRGSFGF